jgi:uncharacterized membrane protein YfcA
MSTTRLAAVAVAAAAGSMVNAIAGGGTLLTFPALIALGVPPLIANATSTVALWPGALSSMYGYRARLRGLQRWAAIFAIPSLLGGLCGAWLLLKTSEDRFEQIVPWLVLGATFLFAVQGPVMRRLRPHNGSAAVDDGTFAPRHGAAALAWQLLVGIYGGYFGAGIGILMLAVLGFMGFSDIHRMNGLKNWGGLCINFVAAAIFAFSGIVDWAVALSMAVGAIAGGYAAAHLAQRVPQLVVRRAIIGVGVASGLWLLWAPLS